MVEEAVTNSVQAMTEKDLQLANDIVQRDELVNELRYNLEQHCLQVLATQQPTATDLRTVLAALHIAGELERMGDHAAGIARLVLRMDSEDGLESLHKLPKIAARATHMLHQVIDAYVRHDEQQALDVIEYDDKVDKLYRKLFRKTLAEMTDESYVRRATYLMWAGHNLERIADRATNIAERVIFMVSSKYVEIDPYDPSHDEDDDLEDFD
jgi:phosphate transport system protein